MRINIYFIQLVFLLLYIYLGDKSSVVTCIEIDTDTSNINSENQDPIYWFTLGTSLHTKCYENFVFDGIFANERKVLDMYDRTVTLSTNALNQQIKSHINYKELIVNAYQRKGAIFELLGLYEDAILSYGSAMDYSVDDLQRARIHQLKADVYVATGNILEATKLLSKAVEINAYDPAVLWSLTKAYQLSYPLTEVKPDIKSDISINKGKWQDLVNNITEAISLHEHIRSNSSDDPASDMPSELSTNSPASQSLLYWAAFVVSSIVKLIHVK